MSDSFCGHALSSLTEKRKHGIRTGIFCAHFTKKAIWNVLAD